MEEPRVEEIMTEHNYMIKAIGMFGRNLPRAIDGFAIDVKHEVECAWHDGGFCDCDADIEVIALEDIEPVDGVLDMEIVLPPPGQRDERVH
jgi:hypothetical protein